MSENAGFIRKLIYLCVIVGLLLPIAWLSMPAAGGKGAGGGSKSKSEAGGKLAQLRADPDVQLAQSSLGEVDPTSETIKLATLGMRGIAANILWSKAIEYKKKEDWENLEITVKTVVRLQPHFLTVWRFQGWNLAYNVSVEWDDYRDRYHWVIRGINFLREGAEVNRKEPSLLWDVGWIISQKIGKSDEHKQFRVLFPKDDQFHNNRPLRERDNWLVGKEYYLQAQRMVDTIPNARVKGVSPLIFHAELPLNQIHYAEALEKDGTFEDVARQAWAKALREWAGTDESSFGQRVIVGPAGEMHLNEFEKFDQIAKTHAAELDKLTPGVKEKIREELKAKLPVEQRAALALDPKKRTDVQIGLVMQAEQQIEVKHDMIAAAAPAEVRPRALELAKLANEASFHAYWVNRYRDIVNFKYWRTRAQSEQTRNALDAHKFTYKARATAPIANFEEAQDAYEEGMEHWRLVLDEFTLLLEDDLTGQDLLDIVKEYQQVLGHLDETFPINGYGLISDGEIRDWPKFCALLAAGDRAAADKSGAPATPLVRIWNWWGQKGQPPSWAEAGRKAVRDVAKGSKLDSDLKNDILYALNQAIKWPELYHEESFAGVTLSPDLARQVAANRVEYQRREVRIFNRQLLEAALGELIQTAPNEFVLNNVLKQHEAAAKLKQVMLVDQNPKLEPTKPDEKKPEDKKPDDKKPESDKPTGDEKKKPDNDAKPDAK